MNKNRKIGETISMSTIQGSLVFQDGRITVEADGKIVELSEQKTRDFYLTMVSWFNPALLLLTSQETSNRKGKFDGGFCTTSCSIEKCGIGSMNCQNECPYFIGEFGKDESGQYKLISGKNKKARQDEHRRDYGESVVICNCKGDDEE